jgi:hypothetical protein
MFKGNFQPATDGGNACVIIKEYGYFEWK